MRKAALSLSLLLLLAMSPLARASELPLPNLSPRQPFDIHVGGSDAGHDFPLALRFSISTMNLGQYHFELLGAPPRDAERTAAQQCVAWSGRVCTERRDVGDFAFHAAHGHWHLQDYALYELRSLTEAGFPDMSPAGLVSTGGKISFCLIDVDHAGQPRDDDPFGSTGFYEACTGLFQGISSGWADTYDSTLQGQQIPIDTVPSGRYAIVVTVDPTHRLFETTTDDNTSYRTIEFSRENGFEVTVL